ncbi:hypothetical protein HPB47_022415 [Ixodes persulcatus]|uniref:Uncharacterized protein n=1 Tax=Ixodes persulcatus TaxID=34615 RepID=A0AC60QAU5_IXOPE|nr:hypothetical protein HPB47_022415 [Ixodes persulcatus]
MAWIDRLSFPVQVWTHFGSQEVERLKNHTMSDTKVIVLVPASTDHQRTVILEHLRRHVICLSLVRLLFVLETADGLSYKEYPESEITSVANVPSVERAIETTEDVDRHARAGLILPCVIEHKYAHRKVTESGRGTMSTLNRLLDDCGPSCLDGRDGSACMRASRRGTHVFLDVSGADGRCRSNMPGISPGKDHFGNFFIGFFVSKAFPYIQEHGNLLSAIFQSVTSFVEDVLRLSSHADPQSAEEKKLRVLMRGVRSDIFGGLVRNPLTTVDEFVAEATNIERALSIRASNRLAGTPAASTLASSRFDEGGTSADNFRAIVRDIVREELRKLLPAANQPALLSIADVVREEVQRAIKPEAPASVAAPEGPTLTYAAVARQPLPPPQAYAAPPQRQSPAPQHDRRHDVQVQ